MADNTCRPREPLYSSEYFNYNGKVDAGASGSVIKFIQQTAQPVIDTLTDFDPNLTLPATREAFLLLAFFLHVFEDHLVKEAPASEKEKLKEPIEKFRQALSISRIGFQKGQDLPSKTIAELMMETIVTQRKMQVKDLDKFCRQMLSQLKHFVTEGDDPYQNAGLPRCIFLYTTSSGQISFTSSNMRWGSYAPLAFWCKDARESRMSETYRNKVKNMCELYYNKSPDRKEWFDNGDIQGMAFKFPNGDNKAACPRCAEQFRFNIVIQEHVDYNLKYSDNPLACAEVLANFLCRQERKRDVKGVIVEWLKEKPASRPSSRQGANDAKKKNDPTTNPFSALMNSDD